MKPSILLKGAFVQGRQILDMVLIANEIVDEKRRSEEEGVVFKIDFEKAYDHAFRGLRQDDPLSPFLFTFVADVLSRMLLRAEERNLLEGFRVGRTKTRVSHLQFADDTIFFSNTREEELQILKSLLLAKLLDCKASSWPILYLGLPLGGNPKTCGFWDPVIERISRRLDGYPLQWLQKLRGCKGIFYGQGLGKVILNIYGSYSNGWDANTELDGHIVVLKGYCTSLSGVFQIYSVCDSEIEDLEGLMRSLDGLHLSPSVSDARS
ncbi:putative mitochondrial protein [Vitis vinifera]|uniref:Putative mitochondrial protein n=1 Tax=Vitis vinifera TaxID=29760 RepID=A0A438DC32_VITVI|nr:putative mitochondrial protein [Vitis vinifera]